jgi:tungstate transport system ATP-binding protein
VKELSSGEAQRVAVARALVIGPKFLFLDEPTASLDPLNTEIIETILQEVNRSINMTILMVTHNMFQAKRIARRIIFVHNGRIVEEAGSEQFFSNPDNELTRKFLNGTMVW